MQIDTKTSAKLLQSHNDILILTHTKPDGDTLGSGFGLLWACEAIGKRARVENADGIPQRYRFITGDYEPEDFAPRYVVSVDVAGPDLLGDLADLWEDRIDLCIDHHARNTIQAKDKLVDSGAPATALIIYDLIRELGVSLDRRMATALFTGITTDTGCFKFYSVTAKAHRAAADMIEAGVDHGLINMLMFDQMSRARVELENFIRSTLEFYFDGLVAFITVERDIVARLGVDEADLDGISSFPRRIEGVMVGVTLREKEDGWRVSIRTREGLNASTLCAKFGGGGHKAAAGCTIVGDINNARAALLLAISDILKEAGYTWRD